ncbi:LacI family transcriptional regulator [Lactiplantibacillus garii]|uniref:LacI family transcriptional regulator n=1 Tax=Lactiplantibacillus garii TaxID=2306423 RepID=A0A426D9H8_9LACO|nr:LacI family DNA-binding transcriptional regulator [Lactiplantibacillus garii]RRK11270.1 LacI family transcriptional regulator [Lactiplantibacillus garii]
MASIREVAKAAGVSVGSISRYLNGQQLKAANMQKIKRAIDDLGYQENIIAKGLKNNQSFAVGLLMNNLASRLSMDIVSSIEAVMEQAGYSILLSGFQGSSTLAANKVDYLLSHAVDGLILFEADQNWPGMARLADVQVPVISLNSPNGLANVDSILVDDRGSVRRLVQHLIAQGHRRIGVLAAPQTDYTAHERLTGVREAVRSHPHVEATVYYGDYSRPSGFEGAQKLIDDHVDALFVCNFNMALGALEYCNRAGIRIDQDLAFSHFDYLDEMSSLISNRLVIQQPAKEIGKMCAERLLSRINHQSENVGATFVFDNLIVGLGDDPHAETQPTIVTP